MRPNPSNHRRFSRVALTGPTARAHRHQQGFTLLEMLIVMFILAITSAIAFPQLSNMYARVEFTLNRETLERALGELPYQAFRQNRDFIITPAKLSADSAETELFALRDPANKAMTEIQVETPLLMTAAQLPLPEGWVVDVEDPIIYRSTGLCSGGELKLKVGAVLYEYDLAAPRCQPILK